ncbi:MAG TPA: hypothetical protein VF753_10330 [Terriglobales bacterium]
MSCKLCHSENQKTFESEASIHVSAPEDLMKLPIVTFPELLICLDCGYMESRLAAVDLRSLNEGSGGNTKTPGV